MYTMRLQYFPLWVSALVLSVAQVAMAAPACSVRTTIPIAARTFAKANDQSGWLEYRHVEEVPALALDSGKSARFWEDRNKTRSVYIEEPGGDTSVYTRYCFNKKGDLESVNFEVRTSLGWGLRAKGAASNKGFDPKSVEFISVKSGKKIPKPAGVSKIPVALKPTIYMNVSELPFASLLAPPEKAAPKSQGAPKVNSMASASQR